jgi:hypothetical protein
LIAKIALAQPCDVFSVIKGDFCGKQNYMSKTVSHSLAEASAAGVRCRAEEKVFREADQIVDQRSTNDVGVG